MPRILRSRAPAVSMTWYGPDAVLAVAVAGLAAGGTLHLSGDPGAGDVAWLAVSAFGLLYAVWAMAE
jgi:Flp pilus assembly protein protease CpaA